jgi:hypothetical protein
LSWAAEENLNIGIALGEISGRVYAFDVDDADTAAALCDATLNLADETAITRSGRGCHIWFRSTVPHPPFDVVTVDGKKLGGVRGDGQYVVVPPSRHLVRQYTWLKRTSYDLQMETTADPEQYVATLLSYINVTVASVRSSASPQPQEEEEVVPLRVPEELRFSRRLAYVRQVLSGQLDLREEHDKSGKLYKIGSDLVAAAAETQYPLTRAQVAGIVKQADITAFGHRYRGHDVEYWRIASKLLPDEGAQHVHAHASPQPTVPQLYIWDEQLGVTYIRPSKNRELSPYDIICNFKPEIIADNQIDDGTELKRSWLVRCTLGNGRSTEFLLRERDLAQHRIETAIHRNCSSEYVVMANKSKHLLAAMQQFSTSTAIRRVPAQTGWMDHGLERVFLMPGAAGGISAHGIDVSIRIDRDQLDETQTILRENLQPYGQGVRPPVTDAEHQAAWDAFCALIECGALRITVPVVLQVLSAPLASCGMHINPPLVHIHGQTGALKTSFALCAISLFGTFGEKASAPASWTSTTNALGKIMHVLKDLPVLIDDYKTSFADKKSSIIRFVQSYADGTTRLRMNTEQEVRDPAMPRGMIISTGEDVWEKESSATARTLVLHVDRGEISPDALSRVQQMVNEGKLQLFGGAYLSWLAGKDEIHDKTKVEHLRTSWTEKLRASDMAAMHMRFPATIANLMTTADIVHEFVSEVFGDTAALQIRRWQLEAFSSLKTVAEELAREVVESDSFHQLMNAIAQGITRGAAAIIPIDGPAPDRQNIPQGPTGPKTEVVAYWGLRPFGPMQEEQQCVFLTRETTYEWFKRHLRANGEEVGFSWRSFVGEAMKYGGEREAKVRVKARPLTSSGAVPQVNGVWVPLTLVYAPDEHGQQDGQGQAGQAGVVA